MLLVETNSPQESHCRIPVQKGYAPPLYFLPPGGTVVSFRLCTLTIGKSKSLLVLFLSCFQESSVATEVFSNSVLEFCDHLTKVCIEVLT